MFRGIHHVAINVRDFDRMARFYKDAFGFEPCRDEFNWKDFPVIDHMIDREISSRSSNARPKARKAWLC